jgi:hypothetical protein
MTPDRRLPIEESAGTPCSFLIGNRHSKKGKTGGLLAESCKLTADSSRSRIAPTAGVFRYTGKLSHETYGLLATYE